MAELFFKAGFHGLKSGFKIDVVGDFLDELLVGDDAVGADDEHGAAEEAEFLDGDAIGRTEGKVAVIGEGFDGIDPGGPAPAGLGEGEVAADGQDADVVGKLGGFGIETAGLHVADGRVEGRNHADDQHLALVVGQRARGEKSGAASPTETPLPRRVRGLPWKVMMPVRSSIIISLHPPKNGSVALFCDVGNKNTPNLMACK